MVMRESSESGFARFEPARLSCFYLQIHVQIPHPTFTILSEATNVDSSSKPPRRSIQSPTLPYQESHSYSKPYIYRGRAIQTSRVKQLSYQVFKRNMRERRHSPPFACNQRLKRAVRNAPTKPCTKTMNAATNTTTLNVSRPHLPLSIKWTSC